MSIFSTIESKLFPPDVAAQVPLTGPVDVEAILINLAQETPGKLNWRDSIVDLLKLVGVDSGFHSRRELARELRYEGPMSDTPAMDRWLQQELMRRLSQSSAQIPGDLVAARR